MMKGRFLLDGVDAYAEFGICMEQYGYNGLLQYPVFKTPDSTTWPEQDGIEVDLTGLQPDARTFQMQLCSRNVRLAEDFFYALSNGAYHTFTFPDLGGRQYTLRMTQNNSFTQYKRTGKLTLTLCEDSVTIPTALPYEQKPEDVHQSGYLIDDVDLSRFGIWVLQGTDESLRKMPDAKENLKVGNSATAGVTYDGEKVWLKPKDVTVPMLINCEDITEFWKRYDALCAALLKDGTRRLACTAMNTVYECYYKSAAVQKFDVLLSGRIWCEFSVTLTLTAARPVSQYELLASEEYELINTENGDSVIVRPVYDPSLFSAKQ